MHYSFERRLPMSGGGFVVIVVVAVIVCVSTTVAATLPGQVIYQSGYSDGLAGQFNADVLEHYTVIGGNTSSANFVNDLRAQGKIFAYNVSYNGALSQQQLFEHWKVPFDNNLGGTLPGGFDAIEIDEILPFANGTNPSNIIVGALAQLRAAYPTKIVNTFTAAPIGDSPATYSNLLNSINTNADLNLFEAYLFESSPSLPQLSTWAANIRGFSPSLNAKTVYTLFSAQAGFPADNSTSVGFLGFLDNQLQTLKNDANASQSAGPGFYVYSQALTSDYQGRAANHYFVDGNTAHFGDGDFAQDITNPQFETTADWTLSPGTSGTIALFDYAVEGIPDTHDSDPSFNLTSHGLKGLKTVRGTTANEATYSATVQAGVAYNISAFAHAGAGTNLDDAKLQIRTAAGALIKELQAIDVVEPSGVTDPWRRLIFNFEAQPGQENIEVVLTDVAGGPGDIFFWDYVEMEDAPGARVTSLQGSWAVDAPGEWNTASNWIGLNVPNGTDQFAIFDPLISSPRTVTSDAAVTVKRIVFDNENTVAIAGTGSITLEADSGNATLDVRAGTHKFQLAVGLGDDTDINVAAGAVLELNNDLNLNGRTLTKTGAGEIALNNDVISAGGTFVCGGGTCSGAPLLFGSLANVGAIVSPGSGVGAMQVAGDYSQDADGVLLMEIGSAGTNDLLAVAGSLAADGALAVVLTGSYVPAAGDQFNLLDFGNVAGQFALDLPSLGSNLAWDDSQLYLTGALGVTAIPEPGSLALVVGCLVLVAVRRPLLK